MGCSTSIIKPAENGHATSAHAQPGKHFATHQKKLVLRNWKFLSNDLTGRGNRIFLRIFQMHPHVKALFPCRHLEGDALKRDANFKGHASRFMQAVGAVVDNIDNYEKALSPLLNALGRKHIHFAGFRPRYFDAFEEAMMYVWAEDLGPKYDEETAQAWHQVFAFIMNELKTGFQEALRDAGMTEEEVASAEHAGSSPVASAGHAGSSPVASAKHAGSSPVARARHTGSSPVSGGGGVGERMGSSSISVKEVGGKEGGRGRGARTGSSGEGGGEEEEGDRGGWGREGGRTSRSRAQGSGAIGLGGDGESRGGEKGSNKTIGIITTSPTPSPHMSPSSPRLKL